MNSFPETTLYVSGSAVMLFVGHECVAHRVLFDHHSPTSLHERRTRIMMRVRDLIEDLAASSSRPRSMHVVFGSPWVSYQRESLTYARAHDFFFTEELEQTLVEQEYANIKKPQAHQQLLNIDVSEHQLNGYISDDPYGQRVNRLELGMLATFVDHDLAFEIKTLLGLTTQIHDVYMQSYWQWLCAHYNLPASGIVYLAGDVSSNVFLIEGGVLQSSKDIAADAATAGLAETCYDWSHDAILPSAVYVVQDHVSEAFSPHAFVSHIEDSLPYFEDTPEVHTLMFPGPSLNAEEI